MSLLREWLSSGTLYGLWALAFALTGAPQHAFNVIPPTAGLVAGYVAFFVGASTITAWPAFVLALLCGIAFSAFVHATVVAPLLRRRDPGRAILLGTLGVLGVTQAFIALVATSESVSLRQSDAARVIFEYVFRDPGIWIIHAGLILIACLAIWEMLIRSDAGRLYRGVCDNRDAALFYRLPVSRIDFGAAILAGAVASVAAILTAGGRAIAPQSAISFAIWGIAGAVMGGRKDVRTALAGGLILGLVEVLVMRHFPTAAKDVLIGTLLVIVLLVRPDGVLGSRARRA